jgi:RNA polymerase sigma-70 factor (ECF subfamily)
MEWYTTSTVLQRLCNYDDRETWERLALRFHCPIVRFARNLGLSQADAEDVGQETLLAFAESFRRGGYDRSKGRLGRWLFGIAYRQALNFQRKAGRGGVQIRRTNGDTTFWNEIPDEPAATASWEREWERSVIELCVDRARQEVEPTTFRAFELVVSEGHSPPDAARLLQIPVKTVYNAKHRVLKRIRDLRDELENLD